MTVNQKKKEKWNFKPAIGLTVISLLLCGFFYPFLITGIGQIFFSYQANGELIQVNGKPIGSSLIAQNFTSTKFFHARNDSASSVDPDITIQDAYSQIPRISETTGITENTLTRIVNENQEGTIWIFGAPYVNVLHLNVELITQYPTVYTEFSNQELAP